MTCALFAAVFCAATLVSFEASADVQFTVGATPAINIRQLGSDRGSDTAFRVGVRPSLLFRGGPHAMGIGGYAHGSTDAFDTWDTGAGVEWLIPWNDELPLVVSGGPYVIGLADKVHPGIEGTLFIGSRSFNYHSWYGLCAGPYVQARRTFGTPEGFDFVIGAQVDLAFVALPFLLAYEAIRR